MEEEKNILFKMKNENSIEEKKDAETMLGKAIEHEDFTYIQHLLTLENKEEEMCLLSRIQLEKLAIILVEFLDSPLKIDAMDSIYFIINRIESLDTLLPKLIERANDISKLMILKGRIDYMKCMKKSEEIIENPEKTHED